jgi:outer membrane protein OmpA-like peptidoglycan-associated protein
MRRPAVLLLAALSGCFLFEPSGPPAQHPEPLPPDALLVASAAPATTGWNNHDDRDGDGIPDARDRCPDQVEDHDGFQDEDGCPDNDNDQDRVEDRCDLCPNEPETYNGFQDEDGCPDRGLVRIQSSRIQIIQRVIFARGQTRTLPESKPLLDELARVLQEHPEIELVACLGHASDDEAQGELLGMKRAQEVRAQLIQRGIDGNRLVPLSVGSRRPIADPKSAEGRAKNRNVELHILAAQGEEISRWNGSTFEDVQAPPPPPTRGTPHPPGCP